MKQSLRPFANAILRLPARILITAHVLITPILTVLLITPILTALLPTPATAQNLQLHYDLRHTLSPTQNPQNFPTLYFEYFKKQDSGRSFIKPGSFLLKTEADGNGAGNNMGKFFVQVSQSFRFWQPKIFLSLQYSGGGGITEPKQYSYYIPNTFSAGAEYPFRWKGAYFTAQLYYRYIPNQKPSRDFLYTLYWWKGLLHYKLEFSGDLSIWTPFFFFAEPQLWFNINKSLALGSKINLYYHVNTPAPVFQVAPTIAIRCRL